MFILIAELFILLMKNKEKILKILNDYYGYIVLFFLFYLLRTEFDIVKFSNFLTNFLS